MVLYIAFIASLNLCLGYALGVYVGILPGLSRRVPIEMLEMYEQAAATKASPRRLRKKSAAKKSDEKAEPKEAAEDASPEAKHTEPAEAEPESGEPETAAEDESKKRPTKEILAGLASFQQQLSQVGCKLSETDASRESIDECAGELKKANDNYLGKTNETLGMISDDENASDEDRMLKATLEEQVGSVEKANAEIDEILAEEDPEKAKERLLESTDELAESVSKAEDAVEEVDQRIEEASESAETADSDAPEKSSDPSDEASDEAVEPEKPQLATMEQVRDSVASAFATEEGDPLHVGIVCFDEAVEPGEASERLLNGLASLIDDELSEGQIAAVDNQGRVVIVLNGDDETHASRRCEEIRQRVASTSFKIGDEQMKSTVSCCFTDSKAAGDLQVLFDYLEESIEEAKRFGANRTFHHDGKIPAPVVPSTAEVEEQEVSV